MSLLVVGSIAFDSIETPNGSVDDALGGSASFFSYAASFFTPPRLVGVVGEDFPDEHRQLFASRGIDTAGLVDPAGRQDLPLEGPLSPGHEHPRHAGGPPQRLRHLRPGAAASASATARTSSWPTAARSCRPKCSTRCKKPKLVLADTMDLWIETQRDDLLALLPRLDGLLLNDSEAQLLTEREQPGAGRPGGAQAGAEVRHPQEGRARGHAVQRRRRLRGAGLSDIRT